MSSGGDGDMIRKQGGFSSSWRDKWTWGEEEGDAPATRQTKLHFSTSRASRLSSRSSFEIRHSLFSLAVKLNLDGLSAVRIAERSSTTHATAVLLDHSLDCACFAIILEPA